MTARGAERRAGFFESQGMHVFVVDDDVDFLKLAKIALTARGHLVEITHESLGVIQRLAGWTDEPTPDVCVLDNHMPALSGIDILRLAAKTRRACDIPVLLYSNDVEVMHQIPATGHKHVLFALKNRMSDFILAVEAAALL